MEGPSKVKAEFFLNCHIELSIYSITIMVTYGIACSLFHHIQILYIFSYIYRSGILCLHGIANGRIKRYDCLFTSSFRGPCFLLVVSWFLVLGSWFLVLACLLVLMFCGLFFLLVSAFASGGVKFFGASIFRVVSVSVSVCVCCFCLVWRW